MDFQCDRCGQKYHVGDEKLQGRAASRFKCKKCENMILLSVPGANAPSGAPPADLGSVFPAPASPLRAPTGVGPLRSATTAAPRATSAPRQRPQTTTGPAYGAGPSLAGLGSAARADASPTPSADADEHGWFAGVRDVPLGPVSRAELQTHIQSGDVTGDTLVWRDGFGDWRPLRAVPALKNLLPPLRVVPPRASHPPLQSFAEAEGDATVISDQGPALVAAALKSTAPDRHDQRLQEAPTRKLSALTDEQLRGIRLPAIGAAAVPEKPPAPLARPLTKPPLAKPLAPKPPPPAPPRASTSAGLTGRAPTLAPGGLTAHRPAVESAPPVEAAAPEVHRPATFSTPPPPASTSPALANLGATLDARDVPPLATFPLQANVEAPAPSVPLSAWDDAVVKPTPQPTAPASTSARPQVEALGRAWADPVFESHVPPEPSLAPVGQASPSVQPRASALSNTGPLGVAVDVQPTKPQRGLPKAAWVLMAGLGVIGVAGGIAISRPPLRRETMSAAGEPPAATPSEPVAAPSAAPAAHAPVAQPGAPDMTFRVGEGTPASPTHRRPTVAHAQAPADTRTAEQRQRDLERLVGLGAGVTPSAPPNLPALRTPSAASGGGDPLPAQRNGAAAAPAPTARDGVREREAVDRVERSGVVRRCWDQFKLRNPAAARRRLAITVSVAATGAVALRIDDHSDPMLTTCIENRSTAQIRTLGPGNTVQTTINVTLD